MRKVSFTGSTEVGRLLLAAVGAQTVKKISMELGGNAPVLVFDDADLDAAVEGVLAAQVPQHRPGLHQRQPGLRAGRHLRPLRRGAGRAGRRACRSATVSNPAQSRARSSTRPRSPRSRNTSPTPPATARGCCAAARATNVGGLFFQPTVLADVAPGMMITREETFGPVTPLIRFTDEAEAIRMANDTEFGLAAYVFSRDAERIWRVAAALEAGMVGINTG